MKRITASNELKAMWEKKIAYFPYRSPLHIFTGLLVLLIFIGLQFIVCFTNNLNCHSIFAREEMVYGIYISFGLGIHLWLVWDKKDQRPGLKLWLYSAFDTGLMVLSSLFSLNLAFLILEITGLAFRLIFIKTIVLVLYLSLMLLCILRRSLGNRLEKAKAGQEIKWAIIISVFVIAFLLTTSVNSDTNEPRKGFIFLSGLFLMVSLILTPLWITGFLSLIMIASVGLPQKKDLSYFFDEERALLQDIYGWLEPEEKLYEFTIGLHQITQLRFMIVLTSRYIRLSSAEGGNNIHLEKIQNICWSKFRAQVRIYTFLDDSPFVFLIWGSKWKARAKNIVEAWKQMRTNRNV